MHATNGNQREMKRRAGEGTGQQRQPAAPAAAVLVIDSDPGTRALVRRLLRSNYPVLAASDDTGALAALQTQRIGVVLCNEYLADEPRGLPLLARIRPQYPHTQLILLSEGGGEELLALAINEVGVLRYLRKPFDESRMRTAIEEGLTYHRQALDIERLQADHRAMAKKLRGLSYRARRFRRGIRLVMRHGRDLALASATTLLVLQALFLSAGVVVLAMLYLLKSALGLDLLEDLHLQDLLAG